MMDKLFRNATLVTPTDPGRPKAGPDQGAVRVVEKGALWCRDGLIRAVGPEEEVLRCLHPHEPDQEVDLEGRCVIPGWVDPHTHLCFAVPREREFSLRLQGVEYLEILRRGGGILSTVRSVRETDEETLFRATRQRALSALRCGTTTVEIKSGYGLDTETELKMLRVIGRIGRETPLDVVPTFLGGHAVPEEYRDAPDAYVDLVVEEMIPAAVRQGIARFCDVFCEKGVFSVAQSRRILQAASAAGLGTKIHADEVHDLGGAGLAAEVGAVSAEHLLAASEDNLRAMARAGTIGVVLPATAYSLRKLFAPARTMVDLGVPVALATDCNPGSSYTESMPFVFGLAVLLMGLSVEEALTASTLNAAYALGMAHKVGSLDVGKQADFLVLEGETPAVIAYHAGANPVVQVYKKGERV
ncbi:imidazolonepropionase [Desulfacinum hydrothermale DSM 13146]|uniref:Imidazolonepropionase n=1 Tax=Desulfacinum hydrothermale DSM 13146 TaxID=1121390 RepID=A0A1W1XM83_9BACT|nr:imidazolonepropionase [Desulfacinum hydrothermale]SMC25036.1 imidazolonepropionase [Desulfacinum hydrothermale DSM 13146]